MTFDNALHPRDESGKFSEKLGSTPTVDLAPDETALYWYRGDVYTTDGIREELGIEKAEPAETLDEVIETLRAGGEHDWSLPTRFTEKRLDIPSDEDGYDLDLKDVGWEPSGGEMSNPYVRVLDDGSVELTGNYYEDMLWSDDFTEEELSDAYPIVEEFFRERFDAEIIDNGESWNSVMLEFSTAYQPEEFTPTFVANTSEERMGFVKFVNEHDPGTFGSPYAYDELRERLDTAVVARDRHTSLKAADGIDVDAVASSFRRTVEAPTDAEAIAIARSLTGDEWSGPHSQEIESLAKNGYALNASGLREGLYSTKESTVQVAKQVRVDALMSWLDSKDR